MKKGLFALLFIIPSPVFAEVSMSNNPISNSSGSVTNMGVLNMPSEQFTNTLSLNQAQCQGDTFVVQPFVSTNISGGTRPSNVSWLTLSFVTFSITLPLPSRSIT